MTVRVEFFGIPRTRAGVSHLEVEAASLRDALLAISATLPGWSAACLNGDRLQPGLIANLNGQQFVSDPYTKLVSGDSLLILSADVGG